MIYREVVEAAQSAVGIEVRHQGDVSGADFADFGNLWHCATESGEVAVHNVAYGGVKSGAGNEAAANVAIGEGSGDTSVGIGGK